MSDLKAPISLTGETYPGGLVQPSDSEGIYLMLPDVSKLGTLPASGEIAFKFKRKDLTLTESGQLRVTLCLCELLEVEADKEEEAKEDDVVDKLFAEATGAPKTAESEDE